MNLFKNKNTLRFWRQIYGYQRGNVGRRVKLGLLTPTVDISAFSQKPAPSASLMLLIALVPLLFTSYIKFYCYFGMILLVVVAKSKWSLFLNLKITLRPDDVYCGEGMKRKVLFYLVNGEIDWCNHSDCKVTLSEFQMRVFVFKCLYTSTNIWDATKWRKSLQHC